MFSRPIIAVAGGCAAVALLASGCGTGGGDSTTVTTSPGPASSAPTGSAGGAKGSAANGGTSACGTSALRARLSMGGVAAGNRFGTLVLTNTGPAACHTYGYPGLQLTGGGNPPTHATRESADGPPKRVTLKPGGSAWSRLQWGAVAGTGDKQTGDCQPTAADLRVTPPDQRAFLTVKWSYGPVCERGTIRVDPLRPGDHDPRSAQ
ncbi:MAG TPA: DUF4232 domain-containing protein [Streptosporangiaceae bacterium]|jgi:hypothetical protein